MDQTRKILKKELSLSRRTMINITIGMILFYLCSILFCVGIYTTTGRIISGQAVRTIANISQLNKDSISSAITNRQILLETLAARLEKQGAEKPEAILKELADFGDAYDFYRMGFMNRDKMVYMTDGMVINAAKLPIAREMWVDQFHLTESYAPYVGGEYMVNTFSCPVRDQGEMQYVLFASYRSINLTKRMNISSMEGKGYTFLLDSQGGIALYPHHYEDEGYNALMKYVNDTPEILPDASGDSFFVYDGERFFAHFEDLGINDWFLMTCVKERDVFSDSRAIIRMVYLSVGFLWITLLFAIGYHFYFVRRTRLRRTEEAFYDEMLKIPNKKALSVVYNHLSPEEIEKMYLVVFDIDKFKEFNYIHGSDRGDELLRYIVRALRELNPNVYLFRYMSDYFVVLDDSRSYRDYEEKIKHVLERFQGDVEAGVIPPFDTSAGVRKLQPGEPLQRVISDALVARERVKGNHLRHYAFYDGTIRNERLEYMEIESRFPGALRAKEFQVYYQPKYDMRTGRIIGAEALARWIRPDGRIVPPGDFIPCLEASRQIITLDEEILCQVCRQMKEMEEEGLEVKRVSVNLSRVHLRNPGILGKIENIIEQSHVDPKNLSFEITETVLYEDSVPLQTIVEYLHALGCKVEMDDYGAGISGPSSLAKNNFDVVKLDKSLTDGLGNERVEDVIRSTAHMAEKWGMEVLVEGVENLEQAERLMELGCSYAQGFCYCKPVPQEAYRALLSQESQDGEEPPCRKADTP